MKRKKISLVGGGQIGGNLALLASQKYVRPKKKLKVSSPLVKKYSNKGYGYEASKFVLNLCKEKNNFEYVDLKVNPKNKKAIKLYNSLGFNYLKREGSENLMILKLY